MNAISLRTSLCLAIAAFAAGAAVAQEPANSSTARLMEEIVVNARGVEEGLQDAPIAVSANNLAKNALSSRLCAGMDI